MILTKQSTPNQLPGEVKNPCPSNVLADAKRRHKLPTGSRAWVPLNRDVKATFSVYKTSYVRLQPFLLIDRT
jgi:hypothetical protein